MDLVGRHVTVIGAGIAGLTASLALASRGTQVRVLEQAAEITEVGAGLQISPNAIRVLDALGVLADLRQVALPSEAVELKEGSTGETVLRMDLPDSPGFLLVHRADLVAVLERAVRAAGVEICLGQKLDLLEAKDGQGVKLRFNSGGGEEADILVGADGLHSQVRKLVERPAEPFFTGQVAWRMVLPATAPIAPEAHVYMGPGRHLVTYPLRDGNARNIVAVEERESWAAEGWHHRDEPMRVARAFSAFAPEVRSWLETAREVHVWGLFRHQIAQRWWAGSAVILGDAAHPTLPFLAQGANLAIEDAWVLAESLAREATLADAFDLYQLRRTNRVRRAVAAANANARNYHLRPGLRRSLAHGALRLAGRIAPQAPLRKFDWLYGHDVTAE